MAITLTTTNQDPQVLVDAFAKHGIQPVAPKEEAKPADKVVEAKEDVKTEESPVEGEKHSEKDPVDGEKPAAEAKTELQDGEAPKAEEKPAGDKPKSRGGFQAKVDKLTAQADRLRDDLEAERGSKARLQAQLDEVNAKLAELNPVKTEEKKDDLVRPQEPTLEEFEFDDAKYKAARAEYNGKLDAYYEAVADRKAEARVAALKAETEKAEAAKTEKARADAFAGRVKEGASKIPNYQEVLEEMPDGYEGLIGKSSAASAYVLTESENPAVLLHFLMEDYLNNDEAETTRLLALSPIRQVIELRAIEERLTKAHSAPEVEQPKPKAAAPPVKEEPKPKKANPEAPIETVGGRVLQNTIDFTKELEAAAVAGDVKLYREIRKQQRAAKQAGAA